MKRQSQEYYQRCARTTIIIGKFQRCADYEEKE